MTFSLLFTSSGVFFFFSARCFQVSPTSPASGHETLFLLFFLFFLTMSCFSPLICILCFCFFVLIVLFCLSIPYNVCVSCLSYPVWWHGIALFLRVQGASETDDKTHTPIMRSNDQYTDTELPKCPHSHSAFRSWLDQLVYPAVIYHGSRMFYLPTRKSQLSEQKCVDAEWPLQRACTKQPGRESPHGRGCTFSVKGFWPTEFPKWGTSSWHEKFTRIFVLGLAHRSAGRVARTIFLGLVYRVTYWAPDVRGLGTSGAYRGMCPGWNAYTSVVHRRWSMTICYLLLHMLYVPAAGSRQTST